jgi:hypothetical protein
MVDLATLTTGTGCTVQGVGAINSVGQFAAWGSCAGGQQHALRLTPVTVNLTNYNNVKAKFTPLICTKLYRWALAGTFFISSGIAAPYPDSPPPAAKILGVVEGAGAVGAMAYVDICQRWGLDPFDPNFQTVFGPQFHTLPQVSSDACITPAIASTANAALDQLGQAASNLQALAVTIDREQSAFTFGYDASATQQDTALGTYPATLVNNFSNAQTGFQSVASPNRGDFLRSDRNAKSDRRLSCRSATATGCCVAQWRGCDFSALWRRSRGRC